MNCPPVPRTEGHAFPFRNEIEAELASRHLIGVLEERQRLPLLRRGPPCRAARGDGDGRVLHRTDDRHKVTTGFWKWVRVEQASLEGTDLSAMTLRDPAELYALAEDHTQYDAPLALTALGEVA